MAIERIAQRLRISRLDAERRGGSEDEAIAHQAQVHGIGAQPRTRARIPVRAEQRERAGGKGYIAELERIVQPVLGAFGAGARAAAAREQELERWQARAAPRSEETGD